MIMFIFRVRLFFLFVPYPIYASNCINEKRPLSKHDIKLTCSTICTFLSFFHPQPMTSDFEGFSKPDLIHYIIFRILILEKEPVFPISMFSAKQGNYWYHFYNVFGMTRSLTGDRTPDIPHSKPALYH